MILYGVDLFSLRECGQTNVYNLQAEHGRVGFLYTFFLVLLAGYKTLALGLANYGTLTKSALLGIL